MNNLLLLGIIIIGLIIVNNKYNLHSIKESPPNVGELNIPEIIPENSFVKPQHKLLELLNNISTADKLYLTDVIKRFLYKIYNECRIK